MSDTTFFTYKNRPLVRDDTTIYYGDPTKKYIVWLSIEQQEEVAGVKMAKLIRCRLMKTDPDLTPQDAIMSNKTTTRPTLYDALELANGLLKQVHC